MILIPPKRKRDDSLGDGEEEKAKVKVIKRNEGKVQKKG